ncbi:transglutaminase family protein [Phnomibacter ginsenosidimutans]|jgi:transglutaminase-like putative cysteine protease|uniref:Transglutaminase family protein n=1 Tax=Phnomibacter ginsenosidimutans TaxID=2676868 RepID=A0A6I6G548_9BACT|nr:transglutaminase family protein [Phnomibacter ginsenosidimutans]QGW27257.1 transglutaminase family protein [Phnomibacter ginsenosidimutans]
MPVFQIHHITQYKYDRPVKESVSQVRIFPLQHAQQHVRQFELLITTNPQVATFTDYYGNTVGDFTVLQPHQTLAIDTRMTVETVEQKGYAPEDNITIADLRNTIALDIALLRLADPERIQEQDAIDDILQSITNPVQHVRHMAWACSEYIFRHFKYEKGITSVETTIDEILQHKSGVCQDFAHVLLQMLRSLGIPARYVSGYICPNKSGMRGEGATHAWVEFYTPGDGWVGIDPTNNVWVNGYHVVLATGRDFNDCSPVKGTFKGIARQSLSVFVSVGYEDGHVFEEVNEVKLETVSSDEVEPWQNDWMQAQQQQQ